MKFKFFLFLSIWVFASCASKPKISNSSNTQPLSIKQLLPAETAYSKAENNKNKPEIYVKYHKYACNQRYEPSCFALIGYWDNLLEQTFEQFGKRDYGNLIAKKIFNDAFELCKKDIKPMCYYVDEKLREKKNYLSLKYKKYLNAYLIHKYVKWCKKGDKITCSVLRKNADLLFSFKKIKITPQDGQLYHDFKKLPSMLTPSYYYNIGCDYGKDIVSCASVAYVLFKLRNYRSFYLYANICKESDFYCSSLPSPLLILWNSLGHIEQKAQNYLNSICKKNKQRDVCYIVGLANINGWWNNTNKIKGEQILKNQCIHEDIRSCYILGNYYLNEKHNKNKALKIFEKLCVEYKPQKYMTPCRKVYEIYNKDNPTKAVNFLYKNCVPAYLQNKAPTIKALDSLSYYSFKSLKSPICGIIAEISLKNNEFLSSYSTKKIIKQICNKTPYYAFCRYASKFTVFEYADFIYKRCLYYFDIERCEEFIDFYKFFKHTPKLNKGKFIEGFFKNVKKQLCKLKPSSSLCKNK